MLSQQNPLVSICIAAYNAEEFIVECIDSLLNQSYHNIEIIVVNDGSIDNTKEILSTYLKRRVIVINQTNKGQCAASNIAYKNSKGDFIKFFDADDILHQDYILEMVKVATPKKLIFSHCINFTDNYEIKENQREYKIENQVEWQPMDFLMSPISDMRQGGRWLIPRSVIEKGGLWDESLSLINDYEYFTRLCLASDGIVYAKKAILYYRQLLNSLSKQKSAAAFASAYKSITLVGNQLLSVENSQRVRTHYANYLQSLVYDMYPKFRKQTLEMNKTISELGGAKLPFDGGPRMLFAKKIIGWKGALWIKHLQNYFKN